ncbi:MAG: hypothetical protein D6701_09920, partial [Gemmatimonadetes bacterium]
AVLDVAVGDPGRVWAASDQGLARFVGDGWRMVEQTEGRRVSAVYARGDSAYFATEAGVFLARADGTVRALPDLAHGSVTALSVGPDGALWVLGPGRLERRPPGSPAAPVRAQGLPLDEPYALHVDYEGTAWLGTAQGAAKVLMPRFQVFDTSSGLPHAFVRALVQDASGRLWVGTRAGLAVRDRDGRFAPVALAGVTKPRIYALAPAPHGVLLIGTSSGLVERGPRGETRVFGAGDGLPNPFVLSLLARKDGTVWVGTRTGLAIWDDGRVRAAPEALQRAGRRGAVRMVEDARGRVWIGLARGGLAIVDGDSVALFGKAQGVTDQAVWDLAVDGDAVWVGTNGDGAVRVTDRGTESFGREHGLLNEFVWQVLVDRHGHTWFYTNQGLYLRAGDRWTSFGPESGLTELEGSATAALEDAEGRLWFGTAAGLFAFDPATDDGARPSVPFHVASITVDGAEVDPGRVWLGPDPGEVLIRLAALTYRDERGLRFRYRVANRGGIWSPPSPARTFRLLNLAPGRHDLEFRVEDWSGRVVAPVVRTTLEVRPTLAESPAARSLAAAMILSLVLLTVRMRTRALRARAAAFEREVRERTRELSDKNAELDAQRAELEATVRELRDTRAELLELGHRAGMADTATAVLHNVGNLLNSVQTSVGRIDALLAESNVARLCRANELLRPNLERLGAFFSEPAGAKLACYYLGVEDALLAERDRLRAEAQRALAKTGAIAEVIADQQRVARHPSVPEDCDARAIVEEAVDMVDAELDRHGVVVEVCAPGPLPPVRVVRIQVLHVFINLLKNAAEALTECGREDGRVRIVLEQAADRVRVLVTDNGCGIDPSLHARVFEQCFTTKEGGNGFGLHSCANYLRPMGGEIRLAWSAPGEGTTFEVTLPLSEEGEDPQREPPGALRPGMDDAARRRGAGAGLGP